MSELLGTILKLQEALDGATALNIYFLHKRGGQLTIDRAELEAVTSEFPRLAYYMTEENLTIKLCSAPQGAEAKMRGGSYGG